MHYQINDTGFVKISKFLQQIKGIHTKNVSKLRKFIEAVYYLCRSECQLRLLPFYYGHWRELFTNDLKKGVSEVFGSKCLIF